MGKSLSDTLRQSAGKPKHGSPRLNVSKLKRPNTKVIKSPAVNKSPANFKSQATIRSYVCHRGKSSPKGTISVKEKARKFENADNKEDIAKNNRENQNSKSKLKESKIGLMVTMFELKHTTKNVVHAPSGGTNPQNLARVKVEDSKGGEDKKSEVLDAFDVLMASGGGKTPKLKRLGKSSRKK